jgi:Xaa-Pro dipeptidase
MSYMVSAIESKERLEAFRNIMDSEHPKWELILIMSKINQFYFTGTMQDGFLAVSREKEPVFWIRRSVERAREESPFPRIEPMNRYGQAASFYSSLPHCIHLEKEIVPLGILERLQKAFQFKEYTGIDRQLLKLRGVKSKREREIITRSGALHKKLLQEQVPSLLQEGMSELDFTSLLYPEMMKLGYQGLSRFSLFQTEILLGQIGFGENSCYPTYFNGPGGSKGQHAAVPLLGDPTRILLPGDMVFADIGFGVEGYHTDHTMTYLYKGELPQTARSYHNYCVEIRDKLAARLRPGEIPSVIYKEIMEEIRLGSPKGFSECFMGQPGNQVKFLGHGVGLHIDEYPVIAKGFDEALEENMIIALEPKCAVRGVGTVGVEDTYVVTGEGGICLTGNSPGMMMIN